MSKASVLIEKANLIYQCPICGLPKHQCEHQVDEAKDIDWKKEMKKASKVLQVLLSAFNKTGHAFEVLGSSDELDKVDDFRDLLNKLIAKAK